MSSFVFRRAICAMALSSCALPRLVFACSVCGCGDPLVIAGDARPVSGNFRLALDAEYLTAAAASDDDPTATESVVQYTLRPVVVWNPASFLSVVLQVPFTRKDWSLSRSSPDNASNTGIGDVDLGARWFLWQTADFSHLRRQDLAISAGTSLPTGPDNLTSNGVRIDDHAQLGTGSFGPYVGALYAFHQDPWNLSINASVRAHTTNSFGYQYGTAALWSVRGMFRVSDPFALILGIDGRYAAHDVSNGSMPSNTGGLLLAAVPGVAFNAVGNLWIHLHAQLPFFTHLFGSQTVGPVVALSLQYSLFT